METLKKSYDLLVIGCGSGGLAASKSAAKLGKKVCVIEHKRIGGTCVNVGCVPKKISFNASNFLEEMELARSYCLNIPEKVEIDYAKFKEKRDNAIKRLNEIYGKGLEDLKVDYVKGLGRFVEDKVVECNNELYTAEHIIIATGSRTLDFKFEGYELTKSSDDFFELTHIPKHVAILGASYIAVELGQLLHGLGSEVTFIVRSRFLRMFDKDLGDELQKFMLDSGIKIENTNIKKVDKQTDNDYEVLLENGNTIKTNFVLVAAGRVPYIEDLSLNKTGIKTSKDNAIIIDEFQNTSVSGVYAIGDVTKKVMLTPVAIKEARILIERIFNNKKDLKMEHDLIPSVIFTHPTIGTVGYSEENAKKTFGENNVKVYRSSFVSLYYSMLPQEKKPKNWFKLVCEGENERVVGLHGIGKFVDEIIQGFAVAIKMKATKKDFDSCVAIHPTSSEEVVLMDPKF